MASLRGRGLATGLVVLLGLSAVPGLAVEQVLLEETFAGKEVGSRPGPWTYFTDQGNDAAVAEAPLVGGHCLRLTRSAGVVWKPMVSGWAAGEPGSTVRLDFDWFLPAAAEDDPILYVTLRGNGNLNFVNVGLGGRGGVAVPQDGEGYVPLGFPLRYGQWGHLCLIADPVSRQGTGAFDLIITQNRERAEYPNIAFRPGGRGEYPNELWYSPTFHVGGGSPGQPREALVTNVRLTTTTPRLYR